MPDGEEPPPTSEARRLLEALSSPSASAPLLDLLITPAEQRALDEDLAAVEAELTSKVPVTQRSG